MSHRPLLVTQSPERLAQTQVKVNKWCEFTISVHFNSNYVEVYSSSTWKTISISSYLYASLMNTPGFKDQNASNAKMFTSRQLPTLSCILISYHVIVSLTVIVLLNHQLQIVKLHIHVMPHSRTGEHPLNSDLCPLRGPTHVMKVSQHTETRSIYTTLTHVLLRQLCVCVCVCVWVCVVFHLRVC